MQMTLRLNDKQGNQIFYWAPSSENWWITGFNPQMQKVYANNLTAIYTLYFGNTDYHRSMFGDFYNRYGDDKSRNYDSRWSFDKDRYIATLTF